MSLKDKFDELPEGIESNDVALNGCSSLNSAHLTIKNICCPSSLFQIGSFAYSSVSIYFSF
jgi:hypothetical protein